ncbi:MAG TPA: 3-phosphoshikimate 1-carboxyvinyltransferase [Limnochordales bacterium]
MTPVQRVPPGVREDGEDTSLLRVEPAGRVEGVARVPPDKSISHRAAIVAAMARGETVVENFLPSLDCLATLQCLRQMGVEVDGPDAAGTIRVRGRPLQEGGLAEPADVLDTGNSGTTFRLLCGLVAAHPIFVVLTGDRSIRRRPMQRVVDPLRAMGATVACRKGGLAPVAIQGGQLRGVRWRLPVASAQVKSAVLLAGLQAAGRTVVEEPLPTRDHTERMLAYFGATVERGDGWAAVQGGQHLRGQRLRVPGDISSAAFVWAAAAALPGSRVLTPGVGLNPTRRAVLEVLAEMGARVQVEPAREEGPEPWGDVEVAWAGPLRAVHIRGARTAQLIDELPVLVALATLAHGTTVVEDAQELRHKESNRIEELAAELAALGLHVQTRPDGFVVEGPQRPEGGEARSRGDHRLAMALTVVALAARRPSRIHEARCIQTSFPGFAALMHQLARPGGGCVVEEDRDGR